MRREVTRAGPLRHTLSPTLAEGLRNRSAGPHRRRPAARLPRFHCGRPTTRLLGRSSLRGSSREYSITEACSGFGVLFTGNARHSSMARFCSGVGSVSRMRAVPWDRSASGTGGGRASQAPAAGSRCCATADRLRSCGGYSCAAATWPRSACQSSGSSRCNSSGAGALRRCRSTELACMHTNRCARDCRSAWWWIGDLEVHRLQTAKCLLHPDELLVAAHRVLGGHPGLARAHDVEPVQCRLPLDAGCFAGVLEQAVLDPRPEVPRHLEPVPNATDLHADLGGREQVAGPPPDLAPNALELLLGAAQQVFAAVLATNGQQRRVAHRQQFARELGGADGGQVGSVEEAGLQCRLLDQPAQSGDPAQARIWARILDAGVGEHPPVADQDQPPQAEAEAQGLDLVGNGGGI